MQVQRGLWGAVGKKNIITLGVRCLWRHTVTSNSRFKSNVLAKFFDAMHIIIHAPSYSCHCIDFKLSVLKLRMQVQNTLNATTKQS